MPAHDSYDYVLVRVVPSIERGECINCGVILFCKTRKFLGALISLDAARLQGLDPRADVDEISRHLEVIPRICAGDPAAGPIACLTQSQRFHWLIAPRSAIIQTSPAHSGMCTDPQQTLHRLLKTLVARPEVDDTLRGT